MVRSHRIRLNPTEQQAVYFRKCCGTARFAYNWGLAEIKRALDEGRRPDDALTLKKRFNAIKRQQYPWVMEVTKCAAECGFTRLSDALTNFFASRNGKRPGKRMGFPRFKSRKDVRQTFSLSNDQFRADGHALTVPRLGIVNMAEPLRFSGKIMSATVSGYAGRWYVSIAVEIADKSVVSRDRGIVGVDLGIKTLAACSDGQVFENQKHLRHAEQKIKRLQRWVSRKQKGSCNRAKAVLRLQRVHERVRNLRHDAIHKMTTSLIQEYSYVALENLNVSGMLRNHHLAKSLADSSFAEIARQFQYKAAQRGACILMVDRFYPSSKTCHECGVVNDSLTLADREWACPSCGCMLDRDMNAALNIRDEGWRVLSGRLGSGYVGRKTPGDSVEDPLSGQSRMNQELECVHNYTQER